MIPARWNAVQLSVAHLHHARVGCTAKTLANQKSNIRAALRWYAREHDVPQRGMPLSPEWSEFRDALDDRMRQRLYSLMRYCSARGINPSSVGDRVFEEYWRYRSQTTAWQRITAPAALWCVRGTHLSLRFPACRWGD